MKSRHRSGFYALRYEKMVAIRLPADCPSRSLGIGYYEYYLTSSQANDLLSDLAGAVNEE